jgi:glycine betaine transporter
VMMVLLTVSLSLAGGMPVLRSFTILVGLPTAILCLVAMVGMVLELEREFPILGDADADEGGDDVQTSAAQAGPAVQEPSGDLSDT